MENNDFWKFLNPEILTEYVNFSRKNPGWKYRSGSQSMQDKQAEGAASIWNILHENNIAILADEVGMGKTIQALSLCATLWRRKPSARVRWPARSIRRDRPPLEPANGRATQ